MVYLTDVKRFMEDIDHENSTNDNEKEVNTGMDKTGGDNPKKNSSFERRYDQTISQSDEVGCMYTANEIMGVKMKEVGTPGHLYKLIFDLRDWTGYDYSSCRAVGTFRIWSDITRSSQWKWRMVSIYV